MMFTMRLFSDVPNVMVVGEDDVMAESVSASSVVGPAEGVAAGRGSEKSDMELSDFVSEKFF